MKDDWQHEEQEAHPCPATGVLMLLGGWPDAEHRFTECPGWSRLDAPMLSWPAADDWQWPDLGLVLREVGKRRNEIIDDLQ